MGCGKMGSAVCLGIKKHRPEVQFLTYTPTKTKARRLAKKVDGVVVDKINELEACDILILACKPQNFTELTKDLLASNIRIENKIIVSIMAAVEIETIANSLNTSNVIRLMPSLPMTEDKGISLLYSNRKDLSVEMYRMMELLKGSSKVFIIKNENEFNNLTLISSSGPAYIYYLANILKNIATSWNTDEEIAKEIVVELFKGACTVMENSKDKNFIKLMNEVMSKKGVTKEIVNALIDLDIEGSFQYSIKKAEYRSHELKFETN